MPKWGLAMEEGTLARWAIEAGADVAAGQEIMDIETTKITNVFESPVAGVLRRKVVSDGETVPVGALLGVVSEGEVPDAEIDGFIEEFRLGFKPASQNEGNSVRPEDVDVGGQRIRHLRLGPALSPTNAPPLLLIHGFGADMTTWMFNQAALADAGPAYAVDLPGHGASTKAVQDGSVAALAATIVAYMNAVAIERAHLVGHSLGAAIALEIASTTPQRATALTLIAPAGLGTPINADFIGGFITESRARKLRPIIEMLAANPAMITADMVENVLKSKRLDGATDALRAIAAANFAGNRQLVGMRDRLDTLDMPAQIIWGAEDRILPPLHGDALPPSVRVKHIAEAGHIPHMEKAAEVNALIRRMSSGNS
jgi:pyruvate dehydrogenase E2 component (dihydrolipoamide acetyltransferase)